MKQWTRNWPLCVVLLLILWLQSDPACARLYSNDRDGAVVGLNIGWGWNRVQYLDRVQDKRFMSDHEGALSGALRIGWAQSDDFMYSLDFHGWTKNEDLANYTILTGTVTLHWFIAGSGFFARGGVGFGSLDVTVRTLPQFTRFTEGGWSLTVGVGHEWRFSPGFAIGLAYDFYYIPVGDIQGYDDVKDYNSNLTINMSWYL